MRWVDHVAKGQSDLAQNVIIANTNSKKFLVDSLVAFSVRLRCLTFGIPVSQKFSALPAKKINFGFLPETFSHCYKFIEGAELAL
jgi:hypothetical protein